MDCEGTEEIRILHVDNDDLTLELAKINFERVSSDVKIVPFTNITSALHSFTNEKYDCVLSDFRMPEIDGISLMQQMKRIKPQVPFILLSTDDSKDIVVKALLAGVDDYFVKSMDSDLHHDILDRVRSLLASTSLDINKIKNNGLDSRVLSMLDDISTAAFITSEEGIIIHHNLEFIKIYGNAIRQNCHRVLMNRDTPCTDCLIDRATKGNGTFVKECTNGRGIRKRILSHVINHPDQKYYLQMILESVA